MKYPLLLIIIILISNACKDNLDIPDTGRKIVINGLITSDSILNVRIGNSAYINDISGSILTDLQNADVKFYQDNNYIDSLYHTSYGRFDGYDIWHVFIPGNYRSKNVIPQQGKEYKIRVKVAGLAEATASTIIPEIVKIDNIDTTRIILPPGEFVFDNKGIKCKIQFTDPAGESNYYLLNICKTPSVNPFYNNIGFTCTDPIVEEILDSGESKEGIAFSDKTFNGQKHSLTIIIRKESIAYVQSGKEFYIHFRLYSITEEYFRYIQTLNLYNKNFGNPLAEPVLMYTNVTGGFGMFTGATVSSDSIFMIESEY